MMSTLEILKRIAAENGIISNKIAKESGISRATLANLCKKNKLSRVSVGQYILSDDLEDEMFSLSKRSGLIVFSHESALFLNNISERTPFEHTVTIPSSKKLSRSISEKCKIYYIKDDLFDMGKTTKLTPMGNPVPVYDMDRTICDIIRSRNRMADETFLSSLKLYAASNKKNLSNLCTYADSMGITNTVRKYMEVLL